MLNHPHIHVLITDGGFLKDGTFRHMLYWDTDKLLLLFRLARKKLLVERSGAILKASSGANRVERMGVVSFRRGAGENSARALVSNRPVAFGCAGRDVTHVVQRGT